MKTAQLKACAEIITNFNVPEERGLILSQWTNRRYVTLRFMDGSGVHRRFEVFPDGHYESEETSA